MEKTVLKLKVPIQAGEETISELTFREATLGDWFDFPASDNQTVGDLVRLAANLCGQPVAILKRMSPVDMHGFVDLMGNLLAPGPETGAKD